MGIKQRIEKLEGKIMAPKGIVVAFSEVEATEKLRQYRRTYLCAPSKVVIFEDPFSECRERDGVEGT